MHINTNWPAPRVAALRNRVACNSAARSQAVLLGAAVLWSCAVAGCRSDTRISVAEFLDMQRHAQAAAMERAKEEVSIKVDELLGPYKVGPSDVLGIRVTGLDQPDLFPGVRVLVDRNGDIQLPTVGLVKVAGLELEDVEDTIRAKFVPTVVRDAAVHVTIESEEPENILVIGAVSVPGFVPLLSNELTILHAVVAAGGVSQSASGKATLRRIRRPAEEVTLDLFDPIELRAALTLDPLERGDIVQVHAAVPNTYYVGGLVNSGSPQSYPPGINMNVLQVLAAAGGLRTDVFPKDATLTRRMSDGTDVHVKLCLAKIARGEEPNFLLAAGDILWVPETFATRVQDFFNQNVFFRAGVSVNYNVSGVEFLNRPGGRGNNVNGGGGLQDSFDPFGFLGQNQSLRNLGG